MLGLEWAPVAGILVGLVVGLTGVGGGALMAPILLLGFGIDLPTVVATDLLFASLTKIVASRVHNKNGFIDWLIVKRLWWGSIPATAIIILLVQLDILFENLDWITTLLGVLILLSGASLLFGSKIQLNQRARRISAPIEFKKHQCKATTVSGFVLGSLVSLTSIGAGALGALLLRTIYPIRMQPKQLVATDTAHAIPISLIAGISYLLMGVTNFELLTLLLIGSIPSAVIGSMLVDKAPATTIKYILSIALIVAGTKLVIS